MKPGDRIGDLRAHVYRQSVEEVISALRTDPASGLGEAEARARLARFGRNELQAERRVPGWRKFLAVVMIATIILVQHVSGFSAIFDVLILGVALAVAAVPEGLPADGAPALALGVDPADPGLMNVPPRPRGEAVITRRMWGGIFFVGAIIAAGTLLVLDASLPGGLIEGSGDMRHAQTMAFTTLVFFSLFTIFNARSDRRSAFVGMFANKWLWGAIGVSVLLQIAVIYMPFLQHAFSTVSLGFRDWLVCAAVASSVLWLRELSKLLVRLNTRR